MLWCGVFTKSWGKISIHMSILWNISDNQKRVTLTVRWVDSKHSLRRIWHCHLKLMTLRCNYCNELSSLICYSSYHCQIEEIISAGGLAFVQRPRRARAWKYVGLGKVEGGEPTLYWVNQFWILPSLAFFFRLFLLILILYISLLTLHHLLFLFSPLRMNHIREKID